MSKIQAVSVCVARVPLERATSFATRTVKARDYCLVKLRSTDGVEGLGFCYAGSAGGRIAQVAVQELLAPVLVGQDSLRVKGLWSEMYQETLLQGRGGSVMRALSALDTAYCGTKLARLTKVVVATGEIACGRREHKELLDPRAAEVLQTDAAVCGGITEWQRIAATAASYGVTMCPHWFHDLHAPLVAATPNARYVEFFLDDLVLNFRRLIDGQLGFEDGNLVLRQGPGLGFDFDEDAVRSYALDRGAWTTLE